MQGVSHKSLFERLRDTSLIAKCEMFAHWTLPQLMADTWNSRGSNVVLERDYQEMGALLVNNLATKLARLLFPASQPFFRALPSEAIQEVARNSGVGNEEVQSLLAQLETKASKRVFMNAGYAQLILAIKHLIVTGNVLLYRDTTTNTYTAYGVQNFAVQRDGKGNLLVCVLREFTYFKALPQEVQSALRVGNSGRYNDDTQVEVYTKIERSMREGKAVYTVTQEVDTTAVGEPSTYPEHLCPWFAPTWSLIAGEHYGRGMVEDYAGGFAKLSDLSEAHALYGIEILRVIHLVSAAAGTDIDDLQQAETGAYVRGDPATVQAAEAGDAVKLQQVSNEIAAVFGRLSRAFMYTVNTRNAERVTAYELQREAEEAEHTLGGVYSTLSAAMQVPMAHVLVLEEAPEALPGLVTGELRLNVEAGLPALGRTTDVQNLMMASQEAAAVLPIAQLDKRLSPQRMLDLILRGRSVDPTTVFYSDEEMAAQQQADAQMQQGQQQLMQAATVADATAQMNLLQGTK